MTDRSKRRNRYASVVFVVLSLGALGSCKESAQSLENVEFSMILGAGTAVRDTAIAKDGSIWLVGGVTGSLALPDGRKAAAAGKTDILVVKLAPDGKYLFGRAIGGPGVDRAYAVEVDDAGAAYIAGRADDGLPTTDGALQKSFGGDLEPSKAYGRQDGFVMKMTKDGEIGFLTYFGGDGKEFIRDLAIDRDGDIYVAATEGHRPSPFVGNGAAMAGGTDGVIAKISRNGGSVLWATYVGGTGDDMIGASIQVDDQKSVYVLGTTDSRDVVAGDSLQKKYGGGASDALLARLSASGKLLWQTYLGGPEMDGTETHQLALDSDGRPIVGITTVSKTGLPTSDSSAQRSHAGNGGNGSGAKTNYPGDLWIARISQDGKSVLASTYFGGSAGEGMEGIGVTAKGEIVCSGGTFSNDLPRVKASQKSFGGDADGFVAVLSADLGKIVRSTNFGGKKWDVARSSAVDPSGRIVASGEVVSPDFPLTGIAFPGASPEAANQSFVVMLRAD